jgi:hypothetical protein
MGHLMFSPSGATFLESSNRNPRIARNWKKGMSGD